MQDTYPSGLPREGFVRSRILCDLTTPKRGLEAERFGRVRFQVFVAEDEHVYANWIPQQEARNESYHRSPFENETRWSVPLTVVVHPYRSIATVNLHWWEEQPSFGVLVEADAYLSARVRELPMPCRGMVRLRLWSPERTR